MGLTRSLTTGASSLRSHQKMLDVVSNNIANINTYGYKSSRANFLDMFSQILKYGKQPSVKSTDGGGVDPLQIGLGVRLGSITNDRTQGVIESTNRPLDMALQGKGYFIVNQNGQEYYTRAGAFTQDQSGNIVDSSSGAYVSGYNVKRAADGSIAKNSNGANMLNAKVENLHISPDTISSPRQTQTVALSGNLSAENPEGHERTTSINVYDNRGNAHSLSVTFTKTANENEYDVAAQIDGIDVNMNQSTLTFNADGSLSEPLKATVTAADLNSALGSEAFDATEPKNVTVQFGSSKNLISGSMTNFGGLNNASFQAQDGYKTGDLVDINVQQNGKITGSFTNGQSEVLGQVVMAQFANPNGLVKEGNNYFSVGPNSGSPVVGAAIETFEATKIQSQSLEQSNVDLTTEFTNMIVAQRAFEAASRIILTSDQMLGQLAIVKR